jgi:thymidylate synthase (FAD)
MDPLFRVDVLAKTYCPQLLTYSAAHQDYAENYIFDEYRHEDGDTWLYGSKTESEAGELVIKHLLAGGRGHFGPLEAPQITFSCGYFPHSVMQQARTHRIGTSFDCQSFRYSGQRIYDMANKLDTFRAGDTIDLTIIEKIFYVRPVGTYTDRQGGKYTITKKDRCDDLVRCWESADYYRGQIDKGYSEEHARSLIPFDVRQHFVVSFNARSLMHFLDLRSKADAQLEIQQLCELMWPHFQAWMPEVAGWYEKNRLHKARLAP